MTDDVSAPAHECMVNLVRELRPDLPYVIAESFVVEALDAAANAVLDAAWARARANLYPTAIQAAANTQRRKTYISKRVEQVLNAMPRPGDYTGGPVEWDSQNSAVA